MTELDNTEQVEGSKQQLSFGQRLCDERKRQNISVADVAKSIHLSEQVIDAIDRSAVEELPQPAFVQGYLRVYAKYLGISDILILEEYAQSVPHQKESDLQPRSTLPDEASSNSPFVKMITISLLVMMVVAALYASFSYYKNAIVMDDAELEDQASLSLPEPDLIEQQDIQYDLPVQAEADIAQIAVESVLSDSSELVEVKKTAVYDEAMVVTPSSAVTAEIDTDEAIQGNAVNQKPTNQLVVKGDDSLALFAAHVSWLEVDDANNENLYYDLLPQDQQLILQGTAPFRIFLGNAPQVKVKINDVTVNIEKYIRSNNIANFSISVDQQQVVFH